MKRLLYSQSDKQQASSGNEDPLEALLAMAAMPKEVSKLAFFLLCYSALSLSAPFPPRICFI